MKRKEEPSYEGVNILNTKYEEEYLIARTKVKEIIIVMNGISEDGFNNRMMNDPYFRSGFDVFVKLFIQAKFSS